MTTLRQKRHHEIESKLYRVQEQRDRLIAALVRVEIRLQHTLKAKHRLERVMAKEMIIPVSVAEGKLLPEIVPVLAPLPNDDVTDIPFTELPIADKVDGDQLEIPDWMKRTGPPKAALPTDPRDLEARIQIETEMANKRIAKSRARIVKMKAKASGDTKQMPLTGKAALNYIRTGNRNG